MESGVCTEPCAHSMDSASIQMLPGMGCTGAPRSNSSESWGHWIGLRENLQETIVFTIKYGGFL